MGIYSRYVLPTIVSCGCGMRPIMDRRRALVPRAKGVVLELGMGPGLNLAFYDPGQVERVYGLEPDGAMLRKARRRVAEAPVPVTLLQQTAETLRLPDASVDTVVSTFTLCTIPDVAAALEGARRVLKPDGRLLFCEHGRAPDPAVFQRQAFVEPLWKRLFGGCHLTRDIPSLVRAAGLAVADLDARYMEDKPNIGGYLYQGSASVTA